MMSPVKKAAVLQGAIAIIVIGLIWFFVANYTRHSNPEIISSPAISPSITPTPSPSASPVLSDLIKVAAPLPNAIIESPIQVSGEARGSWYFEAVFPIKIYDANGNELGHAQGHATSDWMTDNFVPFTATLDFLNPDTDTGKLVLHNDNPSGMPEKDKELDIPVRFNRIQGGITVTGQVLLGPTCPVEPATPTPQCADKPYPTTINIYKASAPSKAYKAIQTDNDANFLVTLAPGQYIFNPKGGDPYPHCTSQTIDITAQTRALNIILMCDTGIR